MRMNHRFYVSWSFRTRLWLLFGIFFLLYYSGSRFNLDGYELEYVLTARNIFHGGPPVLAPGFQWCPGIQDTTSSKPVVPRQNLLQCYLSVPFYAAGVLLFGEAPTIENSNDCWKLPWGPLVLVAMINPLLAAGTIIFIILSVLSLSGDRRRSLHTGILAGIGTMLWPYAGLGMEVTQTFFLMLAVYSAIRFARHPGTKMLLINVLTLVLLTNCKKPSFIFLPPILIYIFYYLYKSFHLRKTISWIMIMFTLPLIIMISTLFIKIHFDASYLPHLLTKLRSLSKGFPLVDVIWGLSISPGKGLFIFNPILLFAIPGWLNFKRESKSEFFLFLGILFVLFAAIFRLPYLLIDEEWGPRYLHSIIPLLIIAGSSTLAARRTKAGKYFFIFILICSFFIQMLGVMTFGFKTWDIAISLGIEDLTATVFTPSLSQIYIAGYTVISIFHKYFHGTSLVLKHDAFRTYSGLGGTTIHKHLSLEAFDHPVGAIFTIRWVLAEKGYHVISEQFAMFLWLIFIAITTFSLFLLSHLPPAPDRFRTSNVHYK